MWYYDYFTMNSKPTRSFIFRHWHDITQKCKHCKYFQNSDVTKEIPTTADWAMLPVPRADIQNDDSCLTFFCATYIILQAAHAVWTSSLQNLLIVIIIP